MHPLFQRSGLILFLSLFTGLAHAQEFQPLFNGKDLAGWRLVNTDPRTWSVQDSMLICSGKPIGELRTLKMYQNFELELEWRHMKPRGNAGVFIWADDITAKGQPFHRGIEIQVLENAYGNTRSYTTHGDIFPIHGARMTPVNGRGGQRAFPTEERSRPSPEWNHYRIVAIDGEVSLAVNGKVVTQGKDCIPRKGYVCIESEGGIVHYRNIRIKELPETSISKELIAIKERGYECLYKGIDLTGWKSETLDQWKASDWILKHPSDSSGEIETVEPFSGSGFLIDVKLHRQNAALEMQLGDPGRSFTISNSNPALRSHLEPVGKWNRIEGTISDSKVSLAINGKPINDLSPITEGQEKTGIVIRATGPVDLANIYTR